MKRRRWVRWAAAVGVGGCLGMGLGGGERGDNKYVLSNATSNHIYPYYELTDPSAKIKTSTNLNDPSFKIVYIGVSIVNGPSGIVGLTKNKKIWSFNAYCYWDSTVYMRPLLAFDKYFSAPCGQGSTTTYYNFYSVKTGDFLHSITGLLIFFDEKYLYYWADNKGENSLIIKKFSRSLEDKSEEEIHFQINMKDFNIPSKCPKLSNDNYSNLLRFYKVENDMIFFRAEPSFCDYQVELSELGKIIYKGKRR